jgi:hypothetical protein
MPSAADDPSAPLAPLTAPHVSLGDLSDDSVAASVYGLVRSGAEQRPGLARELRGSVLMRFDEVEAAVRVDFRGDEIIVCDDDLDGDRAHDLVITGRLGDVNALIATPLSGGLPRPTSARGRRALARLADGRVEFDGPLRLGRRLLVLLSVLETPAESRARRRATKAAARVAQPHADPLV